jgi:hypothetical protein
MAMNMCFVDDCNGLELCVLDDPECGDTLVERAAGCSVAKQILESPGFVSECPYRREPGKDSQAIATLRVIAEAVLTHENACLSRKDHMTEQTWRSLVESARHAKQALDFLDGASRPGRADKC